MKTYKKFILAVSIVASVFAVGAYIYADNTIVDRHNSEGYYVSYDNLDDRIKSAHFIVRATLAGTPENILVNENGYVSGYTLSDIKIGEVLKGENVITEGQTLKIREPYYVVENGLKPGKTEFTYEEYSKLIEGSEYILFLTKKLGEYHISSLHEGKFNIDGKDLEETERGHHDQHYGKLKGEVLTKYVK